MGLTTKFRIIIPLLFAFLLAGTVHAGRTVVVLNDLFLDFSVVSDTTYFLNDSTIVHGIGRVNVEDDGKYILTNARTYYNILDTFYPKQLRSIWAKYTNGDFDEDVINYYNARVPMNISEDLDLQNYWNERQKKVFWNLEKS